MAMYTHERNFRLDLKKCQIDEETKNTFTGIKHGLLIGATFIALIVYAVKYFMGRI